MKLILTLASLIHLIAADNFSKFSEARRLGSKMAKGSKGGGFQKNTRFQPFTPLHMFSVGVDSSSSYFAFSPNAFVYQIETLFGDGEEDSSYCNAIGCFAEHFSFAIKGEKKSSTEWSTRLYTDYSSIHIMCPLASMTADITSAICRDPDDSDYGDEILSSVSSNGPTISSFSVSPSCSEREIEVVCTGTEEDIELIENTKESDSPGWESRPYTDSAIMMAADSERTFWTADPEVTYFELVDYDKDGDANACNTNGCADAYDIVAYLRGPDPYYAEVVFPDGFNSDYEFMCPLPGQTISFKPKCDGVTYTGSFDPDIYLSYGEGASFACSGEESVEIRCSDPEMDA